MEKVDFNKLANEILSCDGSPGDIMLHILIDTIAYKAGIDNEVMASFLLGEIKANEEIDMGFHRAVNTPIGFWTDIEKKKDLKEEEKTIIC